MAKILINCSNLKLGGGIQVAKSICSGLSEFAQHDFIVVISDYLLSLEKEMENSHNVLILRYNLNNGIKTLIFGRDSFLDNLIDKHHVDVVLSIFGPITWTPRCPHICGFARAQLVLLESPYFSRMSFLSCLASRLKNKIMTYYFKRGVTAFYTENSYISCKWKQKVGPKKVYTVTNYYNQVFDFPFVWKNKNLPYFNGITLLCVTANYPHKNLEISIEIAKSLKYNHPDLNFRFVFTIKDSAFPDLSSDLKENFLFIGPVDIRECPSLYKQADIMFQPTLLECFTATYPEAMRMEVPIVTTDLDFARGLCGGAALYYDSLDANSAAEAIYKVSVDSKLRKDLITRGKHQLLQYDNYNQRRIKLIKILENLISNN